MFMGNLNTPTDQMDILFIDGTRRTLEMARSRTDIYGDHLRFSVENVVMNMRCFGMMNNTVVVNMDIGASCK